MCPTTPTGFRRCVVFLNPENPEAVKTLAEVEVQAATHNLECLVPPPDAPLPKNLADGHTFALSLGGDGTWLYAARRLYGLAIPLTGINLGHRGFLSECRLKELPDLFAAIARGRMQTMAVPYFLARIPENQEGWPFINEISLHRPSASGKSAAFSVTGATAPNMGIRADGLMLSSATGSTGYNLSAGGPVVHPWADVMVLTAICPTTPAFRPIVLPAPGVEKTTPNGASALTLGSVLEKVDISVDGVPMGNLEAPTGITVTKSPFTLARLRLPGASLHKDLAEKLGYF